MVQWQECGRQSPVRKGLTADDITDVLLITAANHARGYTCLCWNAGCSPRYVAGLAAQWWISKCPCLWAQPHCPVRPMCPPVFCSLLQRSCLLKRHDDQHSPLEHSLQTHTRVHAAVVMAAANAQAEHNTPLAVFVHYCGGAHTRRTSPGSSKCSKGPKGRAENSLAGSSRSC